MYLTKELTKRTAWLTEKEFLSLWTLSKSSMLIFPKAMSFACETR